MVEISTKPTDGPPTRTIGDPSTGTELQTPGADDQKDEETPISERPAPTLARPTETMRGLHLTHLPKASTFTVDGALVSPAPSAGTSGSGSGPTSVGSSSSQLSNGQSAPVQYETKLNVLVVDDDPLTRKLMSRMLTRIGCKVATAEHGEIALDMILGTGHRATPSSEDTGSAGLSMDGMLGAGEEYRYAVIFLDNQMPVLSGLDVVTKLRELGRKDFVVGVTGASV